MCIELSSAFFSTSYSIVLCSSALLGREGKGRRGGGKKEAEEGLSAQRYAVPTLQLPTWFLPSMGSNRAPVSIMPVAHPAPYVDVVCKSTWCNLWFYLLSPSLQAPNVAGHRSVHPCFLVA
jgi:hypothetical protein